jgi:hypothetical protein
MAGEKHGDPLVAQAQEKAAQKSHPGGVDAIGGLVEHHQLGVAHEA